MKTYQTKAALLPGSSYGDVVTHAKHEQTKIQRLTKRQPYVRSAYFNNDKIFITSFMSHTMQKGRKSRVERLRLYAAAIELLRKNRHEPEVILKADLQSYILYRFYGKTRDGQRFCVQVKQHKRTGRKDFMSAFNKDMS